MEAAARWLSVSLDTVRAAYLQLKQNGSITLTKRAGPKQLDELERLCLLPETLPLYVMVRRALTLLNQPGAADSSRNCGFPRPVIRKRLLDFAQSLQILTLTCGAYLEITFDATEAPAVRRWRKRLLDLKESGRKRADSSHFLSAPWPVRPSLIYDLPPQRHPRSHT